jgi:archaeosine-15-forming tRNA-guanine transglycosylase
VLINTFEIKQILNKNELLFSLRPYNNIGILLYTTNIKTDIGEIILKPFTKVIINENGIYVESRLNKNKNIQSKIIIKEMEIENVNEIIIENDDLSLVFLEQEFIIDGKIFNSWMLKYNGETKKLKMYEYSNINQYSDFHEYVL